MAEFSRSQDGQFMAEHSVRGHQKRDYPVALAQSQEDSKAQGPPGQTLDICSKVTDTCGFLA